MPKAQLSWVRSHNPPTQWNLRSGRWSSVEYLIEKKKNSWKKTMAFTKFFNSDTRHFSISSLCQQHVAGMGGWGVGEGGVVESGHYQFTATNSLNSANTISKLLWKLCLLYPLNILLIFHLKPCIASKQYIAHCSVFAELYLLVLPYYM
jgi:hypothetical protein